MMMATVHRRCAFAGRCVNKDTGEPDPETGKPIPLGALIEDGLVCEGCYLRLDKSVQRLAGDWRRLRDALGEHRAAAGDKVLQTPEPAIPLNTGIEALMTRIVETAGRAAEMIGSPPPDSGRQSTTRDIAVIEHSTKALAGSLDRLLAVGPQPAMVWGRIPSGDEGWDDRWGQPRELVELSGLDVAKEVLDINRLVGVMLGKTRLRHHYSLPCPAYDTKARRYCGAMTVGRDDGADRFDCSTCGTSWTEAEYGLLRELLLSEIHQREETELLYYLLAEAYWRLDTLRLRVEALEEERETLLAVLEADPSKAVEVVELIATQLAGVLTIGDAPHPTPDERRAGTPDERRGPKAAAAKGIEA